MDAPTIVHVDVDAFFASVERVLRPELRGLPVVVGGGVEGRGVVASASYEARRFGLRAGMPIWRARERCPEGVFLPPRFAEYNRFSERVFEALSEFSPSVEQASPDEAYVDLRGCERLYGALAGRPLARPPFVEEAPGVYRRRERRAVPPGRRTELPPGWRWTAAVGLRIKRVVRARTGLDVSVGVGSNRLVAKAASDFGKPDGMVAVAVGREMEFLGMLPLGELPGIGRATLERLLKWNVRTVAEARRLPLGLLQDAFGLERGRALFGLLRGRPAGGDGVRERGLPKSMSRETTFWTATGDYEFVEAMLFYLTERLGRALRREGMRGRTVQVKLRYQDMSTVQCARSLARVTDRDEEIFAAARALLGRLWRRSRCVRLVGVGVSELRPWGVFQSALLDDGSERSRRLDRCLDGLRERFGFDVVRRGLSINLAGGGRLPEPARLRCAPRRSAVRLIETGPVPSLATVRTPSPGRATRGV